MMNSYRGEAAGFEIEVEQEAARLIRDGYAAPFDAIVMARESVKRRRQQRAVERARSNPAAQTARE